MKDQTLYIASGNKGKLRDFALAAASTGTAWTIATLPGLASIEAPPEDGTTFEANARAKALFYGAFLPDALVLADDSGLMVDALDGAPGVYSARFAERAGFTTNPPLPDDERNNACLLAQLESKQAPRTAHYRCTLAVARQGTIAAVADGVVSGEILAAPRGTGGFGYDPLFFLPGHNLTMAELDAETRLGLSHRGAALRALLHQLTT